MPKGKKEKKGGKKNGPRPPGSTVGSDEDAYSDITSISGMSDARSVRDLSDDECTSLADTEDTVVENFNNFQDKMKDAIENLSEKSLATRMTALTSIANGLKQNYVDEFLDARKLTIGEALLSCLKKGKGEEQALAAQVVSIINLQIADQDDPELLGIWSDHRNVMQLILQDRHASPSARAACAQTLGLCSLLLGTRDEQYSAMSSLEACFKDSYLKGDGSVPAIAPELANVHIKALHAWNLLVSRATENLYMHLIQTHLPKLSGILESGHVDLRIAAGESIALLYELARIKDQEFEGDLDELIAQLKELSKDSSKYRGRKERQQQRACFRDILRSVEEGGRLEGSITFDREEKLFLDSWQTKIMYEEIKCALGVGTNFHLDRNYLVRDIFSLGPPKTLSEMKANMASKQERKQVHSENNKIRSIHRGRNRDKRNPFM